MLHRTPLGLAPGRAFPEARILLVAVLAAALTAFAEYAWHATLTGLPAERILAANLDLAAARPAVLVLAAAALPALLPLGRRLLALAPARSRGAG